VWFSLNIESFYRAAFNAGLEAAAKVCEERHDLKIATTYDWTRQVGQYFVTAIYALEMKP
jgi:hypothetical protein